MECCHGVSCLRISVDRKESIGRKYKGVTMAQWDNHLQNIIFLIRHDKPLFRVIFEALHLAQLGLMAGWLACWLALYTPVSLNSL